ncbi:polysaccharide biosynthesis protein [Chitinimonas koreensis]|uniref:polysaccharide biosynthesis protein n=1 Tax=Chitinimonas koreensis TaxID=356302 RepID=UPI000429C80D|nr:nucleoside-diphosphate sugar epimerase/dehydratase [Chitinimonas koreensis]QNM97360.1 polysaccharide biosynthesis protein [Chitinimonas koreensis]
MIETLRQLAIHLPQRWKSGLVALSDLVVLPLALWTAIALRLGTFEPDVFEFFWLFAALPLASLPIFLHIGLYRAVVRYLTEQMISVILLGATLSTLALTALSTMLRTSGLPRSSVLIYWLLAAVYMVATRFAARALLREDRRPERERVVAAVYGADAAGRAVLAALRGGRRYRPAALFDSRPEFIGRTVAGLRVYPLSELETVVEALHIRTLLLAEPLDRTMRRALLERLSPLGAALAMLPDAADIAAGHVDIEQFRAIDIEDVLGRDPVAPIEELLHANIDGQAVLVTGAGGSIGAELCRQIAAMRPRRLILLEQSELALYQIEQALRQQLRERADAPELVPVLGSIRDRAGMAALMAGVDTVYHAAAYKHVPLLELNPLEAILNNSLGTLSCALAADQAGVKRFVLISTDKAVRPGNMLGRSKRLAERVVQHLSQRSATVFCAVRFGNVLGSSGSVLPLFRQQIAQGGPLTVTDPRVTRYFMTIAEASQLVLQAGAMAQGGEIFVLDMGEPVPIVELARKVIQLSGLSPRDEANPDGSVEIRFTGLRPGEKLHEELLIEHEAVPTRHPRIARERAPLAELDDAAAYFAELEEQCRQGRVDAACALVERMCR